MYLRFINIKLNITTYCNLFVSYTPMMDKEEKNHLHTIICFEKNQRPYFSDYIKAKKSVPII